MCIEYGRSLKHKVCPHCGKEFFTTKSEQIFCNRKCSAQARCGTIPKPETIPVAECPYNYGVECGEVNCDKCGWNPKVTKARLEKYRSEHNVE